MKDELCNVVSMEAYRKLEEANAELRKANDAPKTISSQVGSADGVETFEQRLQKAVEIADSLLAKYSRRP